MRTCVCAHAGCEQGAESACVRMGVAWAPTLWVPSGGAGRVCAGLRCAWVVVGMGCGCCWGGAVAIQGWCPAPGVRVSTEDCRGSLRGSCCHNGETEARGVVSLPGMDGSADCAPWGVCPWLCRIHSCGEGVVGVVWVCGCGWVGAYEDSGLRVGRCRGVVCGCTQGWVGVGVRLHVGVQSC